MKNKLIKALSTIERSNFKEKEEINSALRKYNFENGTDFTPLDFFASYLKNESQSENEKKKIYAEELKDSGRNSVKKSDNKNKGTENHSLNYGKNNFKGKGKVSKTGFKSDGQSYNKDLPSKKNSEKKRASQNIKNNNALTTNQKKKSGENLNKNNEKISDTVQKKHRYSNEYRNHKTEKRTEQNKKSKYKSKDFSVNKKGYGEYKPEKIENTSYSKKKKDSTFVNVSDKNANSKSGKSKSRTIKDIEAFTYIRK